MAPDDTFTAFATVIFGTFFGRFQPGSLARVVQGHCKTFATQKRFVMLDSQVALFLHCHITLFYPTLLVSPIVRQFRFMI